MENMKSFFGTSGLSSTSANHYANMAKEMSRKVQNYLYGIQYYDTSISIIGDSMNDTISHGVNSSEFTDVRTGIDSIAKLNSLIAFFREAVKEKDRLLKEAGNWEDTKAREALNVQIRAHNLEEPSEPVALTKDDIIKTWSIGEQEKYLSLEAEAAAFGSYIHEDGPLSIARIDLMNKISKPINVVEKGRDTVIYRYTPTVSQKDVDDFFFSLQSHYREVQAELNGMKKSIQDALNKANLENQENYRLAMQEWHRKEHEYAVKLQEISEFEKSERIRRTEEIQKLKIVVPKRLQDIYDSLQKLG